MRQPTIHRRALTLREAESIRADVSSALAPIAQKHRASVNTLLKLGTVGGGAQA